MEKITQYILYLLRLSLIVAFFVALVKVQWIVMFATTMTLALTFVPYMFQKLYNINLPIDFVFLAVLFIYATLFLGEVHGFYQMFWWWDSMLHGGSAMGFGFIGFIILYILHKAGKLDARPGIIGIFAFSFALAIGALWEVFEFSGDQIFGTTMQKNGLHDTMWDLIVDAIGAFIAAFLGYLYLKGQGNFVGRAAERFVQRNKWLVRRKTGRLVDE